MNICYCYFLDLHNSQGNGNTATDIYHPVPSSFLVSCLLLHQIILHLDFFETVESLLLLQRNNRFAGWIRDPGGPPQVDTPSAQGADKVSLRLSKQCESRLEPAGEN